MYECLLDEARRGERVQYLDLDRRTSDLLMHKGRGLESALSDFPSIYFDHNS